MDAVATSAPFGSRKSKPWGRPVSWEGSAIEKLSPAAVLSGTHHCTSVRTLSDSCGLVGVTVMLSTGFGIVAASEPPAAIPATPPIRRQEANNFEPVRPNLVKLINGTVLSIARSGEYCGAVPAPQGCQTAARRY